MSIQDKIKKLQTIAAFDSPTVTEQGHGSFLIFEDEELTKKAHRLKKEADKFTKIDPKIALKIYTKSILLYIQSYLENEVKTQTVAVSGWKGLCVFINGLIDHMMDVDSIFVMIMRFIQFNMKFYYMYYEAKAIIKREEGDINFSKDFLDLKFIIDKSKMDKMYLVKMEKLVEHVNEVWGKELE